MRKLKEVFKFEFLGTVTSKSYYLTTIILVLVIAVVLTWPRFGSAVKDKISNGKPKEKSNVALILSEDAGVTVDSLNKAMEDSGYQFVHYTEDLSQLNKEIDGEAFDSGVVFTGPLNYTRYVRNTNISDSFDRQFREVLLGLYRMQQAQQMGLSEAAAETLLMQEVETQTEVVEGGKDGAKNFLYTYILIFALYMAVLMHGSTVASSVATEKSTRTMELLITSADPASLLFGKVLGAGSAGLLQMGLVLGSAVLFYNLNISYYQDNYVIQSLFAIPISTAVYALVFFLLGFFIYAFMYAAMASLISRMEELNLAIQPIMWIFIVAFMITIFSITSGYVNNPALVVASFIPFTSPMAMFARIAMGEVANWQIILSISILTISTIGMGYLATIVYRLGVIMYGTPPKLKAIFKMIKANKAGK